MKAIIYQACLSSSRYQSRSSLLLHTEKGVVLRIIEVSVEVDEVTGCVEVVTFGYSGVICNGGVLTKHDGVMPADYELEHMGTHSYWKAFYPDVSKYAAVLKILSAMEEKLGDEYPGSVAALRACAVEYKRVKGISPSSRRKVYNRESRSCGRRRG